MPRVTRQQTRRRVLRRKKCRKAPANDNRDPRRKRRLRHAQQKRRRQQVAQQGEGTSASGFPVVTHGNSLRRALLYRGQRYEDHPLALRESPYGSLPPAPAHESGCGGSALPCIDNNF